MMQPILNVKTLNVSEMIYQETKWIAKRKNTEANADYAEEQTIG